MTRPAPVAALLFSLLEQAKKGRGLVIVATEMVREMLEFDEFEGSDHIRPGTLRIG